MKQIPMTVSGPSLTQWFGDKLKELVMPQQIHDPSPSRRPLPTPTVPHATPTPTPTQDLSGFTRTKVPEPYAQKIMKYSQQYQVHPSVVAAKIYNESGFNPRAINRGKLESGVEYEDRGMGQISSQAYPNITPEQAYDPDFAIDFVARTLSENNKYFNDLSKAIAAYNVGRGGASIKGPMPYGGGPKGQQYLDRVSQNMSPELVKQLGLKVSY